MRPAPLVAIGTVVLLALPLAGCAAGTPAAALLASTGGPAALRVIDTRDPPRLDC